MSADQSVGASTSHRTGRQHVGTRPDDAAAERGRGQLRALQSLSEEALTDLQAGFEAEIALRAGNLLTRFPVSRYLSFFAALPGFANYNSVPLAARGFCEAIEAEAGTITLEAYHKVAMIRSILGRASIGRARLTADMDALLQHYQVRVIADMASHRNGFYLHENNQFAREFAVCRGKLLPCGVELIDPGAGVPRRLLLDRGMRGFFGNLRYFGVRSRGFRPFYELHFDRRCIQAFNEAGYAELYLRIADMLSINPHIRGMTSSSWWHDPQIADISPELAFIDRHPKGHGARCFFVGEHDGATADATRFAPRRKRLHSQGLYRPGVHLLVWARRDILEWTRMYRRAAPDRSRSALQVGRDGVVQPR